MDGRPRPVERAVVGQMVEYKHFQLHAEVIPPLERDGYRHPFPRSAVFDFELTTVGREAEIYDWFQVNWNYSIIFSVLYMVLIFVGQRWMKHRARFELRWPLIVWSGILAVYSVVSCVRSVPELVQSAYVYGFHHTVCNPNCFYGVPGFWALIFVLSKVLELGDTAFIVLRKQPLIFLHWYHHVTVLCYSWITYADHTAPGRWFTIMNMFVHAVMYTYYFMRAARFRVPRPIMMSITTLQISQMVIGIFVTFYMYYVRSRGIPCHFPSSNMYWAFAMYLSYFCLFVNYFYRTYIRSRPKPVSNGVATKETNGMATKNGAVHQNGSVISNGHDAVHANGHTKKVL